MKRWLMIGTRIPQAGLEGVAESLLEDASFSSNPSLIPRRNSPTAFPSDFPNSGSLFGPNRISTTSTNTNISPNPIFPISHSPSNKLHVHLKRLIRKTVRQRRQGIRIQDRPQSELVKKRIPGRLCQLRSGNLPRAINDKSHLAQRVWLKLLRGTPLLVQPVSDRFQI